MRLACFINQSAFRKGVSCGDAVFAMQEMIAKYLRGGSHIYMCLYDLQKAFDSPNSPREDIRCWCKRKDVEVEELV